MLQTVDLGRTSLAAYRGLAPDEIVDELERLGRELATGVTVITFTGGCHLARDTRAAIEAAGFAIDHCERFVFRTTSLAPAIPHILGAAHKPAGGTAEVLAVAEADRAAGRCRPLNGSG